MEYLVTGGAGFIGSHIVEALLKEHHTVRVLDNLSTGKKENLAHCDRCVFIEGDIVDKDTVDAAVQGVDIIFHEAAMASVPKTIDDPVGSHEVNVTGALNIFEAARKHAVKRVVYASSAAVYGEEPTLPKVENMRLQPTSFYGEHKIINEFYANLYSQLYGLETVGLRYFNVFGERQDPSSPYSGVISRFLDSYISNQRPTIFGDGEQSRDFIYVKDVVQANFLASTVPNISGSIFNIGTGNAITLNEIISILNKFFGVDFEPSYEKVRHGDIKYSYADISKAIDKLGLSVQYHFYEGIQKVIETLRR